MYKLSDLRNKEVINIKTGTRLGLIEDMVIDTKNGVVKALVITEPGKLLGFLRKNDDLIINWSDIKTIGDDFIVIELDTIKRESPVKE